MLDHHSITEFPYDLAQATCPYYYSCQNYAYIPTFLKRLLVITSRASWKCLNMVEKSTKVQSNLNKFFNISNNKVEQKKTICRIDLPTIKEDKEQRILHGLKLERTVKKLQMSSNRQLLILMKMKYAFKCLLILVLIQH